MGFATLQDLQRFLGKAPPDEGERLLERATRLIDRKILVAYPVSSVGDPTDAVHIEALRDATCAQVEWWMEIGDELGVTSKGEVKVGNLSLPKMGRLAPRAEDYLLPVGLLDRGV